MNRRDSIMNKSETQPQPKGNTANDISVQDYHVQPAIEEFDATAAALSRLSVFAESNRNDGSASPLLNLDSTYETSTLSSCPSPAKRPSETFDTGLQPSDMKRLRRETGHTSSLRTVSHNFARDLPVEAKNARGNILVGLGLDCADMIDFTTSASTNDLAQSRQEIVPVVDVTTITQSSKHRKRARSTPTTPSSRWLQEIVHKKRSHNVENKQLDGLKIHTHELSSITKPPITQQTLKELELNEIFKNAQLRHDIVHDPNLQFRPNTDGERGAKKRHEANRYWRSIVNELDHIQTVHKSRLARTRLSVMFQEMKDILLSLVPVSEKVILVASFDHELFLQTLSHGLFSAVDFARFMSSLMKRHCAPMRDEAIDETVRQIETATSSVDFADALRSTFDVLEMMKLDVANHQLRTLRGYLLDTAIDFEKSWFLRKYQSGSQSIESGRAWFKTHLPDLQDKDAMVDHRACFIAGLMSLFKASTPKTQVPSTFNFDSSRMLSLRKDVRELVYLNLVLLVAKQVNKTYSVAEMATIRSQLLGMMSTDSSRSADRWIKAIPNIALQLLTRFPGSSASGSIVLPGNKDLDFIVSWLTKNMNEDSTIFSMVQTRLLSSLNTFVYYELTTTTANGQKAPCVMDWGMLESTKVEAQNIARRMTVVADYHWKVHGSNYIQWSRM